jgi:hypothetical protein
MAVCQTAVMLNVLTLSLASQLLQGFWVFDAVSGARWVDARDSDRFAADRWVTEDQ